MAFPAASPVGLSNRLHILASQFQERAEVKDSIHSEGQGKGQGKSKAAMKFFSIRLLEKVQEYEGVHTFRFQPLEPMPYEAGMYVHLKAPGDGEMRQLVRHMSFASAPEESTVAFSMDLASGSAFKTAMSALCPGDTADLFKLKFKHFELVSELQREVIFLAGGLGITPIRSLLLSKRCAGVDWSLIHVARDGKHLYESELRELPGLQVRTDHKGAASAVLAAVREKPEAWYYVCGSGRFVEGMESLLHGAGVSSERLRVESFK
jgi:ferredoxin-NADP reductase